MSLKAPAKTCSVEVYGPDEDGAARLICGNVDGCPLGHPGVVGLDCFGAARPPESDSHMVVGRDARRDAIVRKYADKLSEISMEMYLEQEAAPLPPRRRLKRRKCHTLVRTGGMIRMQDEDNPFEVEEVEPAKPTVAPERELRRPLPTVDRPEKLEEDEDEEPESAHGGLRPLRPEEEHEDEVTLIDDWETVSSQDVDHEIPGYVVNLIIQTDEDRDKHAIVSIDHVTVEIKLGDFIEIVEALGSKLPRMRRIQSS